MVKDQRVFIFYKNKIIKSIDLIIFLIIYLFISDSNVFTIILKKYGEKKVIQNNTVLKNKETIKNDPDLFRYNKMLPFLSKDLKIKPKNKDEIFNSRQIFISDARITPDYIRYIRPINESKKQKYRKHDSSIDTKLFEKRNDQYNYKEFCKLAWDERLINDKNIEFENEPIISIVVPSYNKQKILLKSIRSIQNQIFKKIEIIIVNDCSNDNSSKVFNYLLETEPRIRIFHHIKNLGLYRSRLDGILYSKGKYIITFDTGDLYEDNYVLLDAYNVIEKYNLDSCKFLYRQIKNFSNLNNSIVPWHIGNKDNIEYEPENIKSLNTKVFHYSGCIWNRLVKANIYIKSILLLNELMLNVYKNMWEDVWYNDILNRVSYSYGIFERVGYIYINDGQGEGTPKYYTMEQKSNMIREYIGFLYFYYNFCNNIECKEYIIRKLRIYNEHDKIRKLKNFISHFEMLNNLLEALIKDRGINQNDKKFCEKLLYESKIREKEVNKNKQRKI